MKILNYLIVLLTILSCGRQTSKSLTQIPTFYCLNSEPIPGKLPVGDTCEPDTTKSDYTTWCAIEQADTLLLSEASKCWIPQYKYDIGTTFTYLSADEYLELELTDKGHVLAQRVLKTEACDTPSAYKKGLCYNLETYYILLEGDGLKLYIEMTMDLITAGGVENIGKPDEKMRILRINDRGVRGYGLRAREFDDSPYMISKFAESKTLQGRVFSDVYNTGSFYYNKELGLIGFGFDGESWVLEE